ncbi:MAG TPA: hypothetical protein VKG25_12745 [Bryobacteraceae bacterium]|nr:hypothetical protein [Bryobacteraceae bacterium]
MSTKPSVVVAFVTGAALASGIVYVAVSPKAESLGPAPQLAAATPLAGAPAPKVEEPKPPAQPEFQAEVDKPAQVAAPSISAPSKVDRRPQEPAGPAPPSKQGTLKLNKMVAQLSEPVTPRRSLNDAMVVKTDPPPTPVVPAPEPPPPAVAQPPGAQEVAPPATEPPAAEPPPPPAPNRVMLQAGVNLDVRIGETLSTKRNRPGDNFLATLAGPLVVDGWVIAERGARVEGRVVESDSSGRVQGTARLSVELVRLSTSDGQRVRIQTEPIDRKVKASTGQDAAKVGGGAALGAIIGAVAGGGKGAGIGAGAGGAAGAVDVLLTRKPAEIPVESRLTFRITNNVEITEKR